MTQEDARKKAEPYLQTHELVFVSENGVVRYDISPFHACEFFSGTKYWAFEQPKKLKKNGIK